MDQILQFVLNNGGSKGSEGSKWIKFSNSCRTMGGLEGSEGSKWIKFSIRAEQWPQLPAVLWVIPINSGVITTNL